jgi:hypothetical protein
MTRADVVGLWGGDRDALRECRARHEALAGVVERIRAEVNGQ